MHLGLVLRPCCVSEKVGVNKKGESKNDILIRNKGVEQ
jgi:hypothetical protein